MPTVVLRPSRRRQLDVLPPGTLRSSGMSPDDARWAGSTEPEPRICPSIGRPNGAESLDNLFIARGAEDLRTAVERHELAQDPASRADWGTTRPWRSPGLRDCPRR